MAEAGSVGDPMADRKASSEATVPGGAGWAAALRSVFAPAPVALATCAIVLSVYHAAFYAPAPRIATVDLEAVILAKQAQFVDAVSGKDARAPEAGAVAQMAERFSDDLGRAVRDLAQQCGCLLLVKGAVIGTAERDLTDALKQRLNLGDVDVAAVRARLARGTEQSNGTQR